MGGLKDLLAVNGTRSAGRTLSLDEFTQWLHEVLEFPECAGSDVDLSLTGDLYHRFLLMHAFDALTGEEADPTADICAITTVRELYLYYLFVISRPLEDRS